MSMSRIKMLPRLLLGALAVALAGCQPTISQPLGNGYFFEGEKNIAGGGTGLTDQRIVYRKDGHEKIICREPGYFQNVDDEDAVFYFRVYGDNVVYILNKNDGDNLVAYSAKAGRAIVVDSALVGCNLVVDEKGIRCTPSKIDNKGQERFYSADYLKGL